MSGSDSGSDEDTLLWSRGLSGGDSGGEGGRSDPPIDNNHREVLSLANPLKRLLR